MRKQDDTTEAAAEWLPIESLTPWADNPRDNAHAVPEVAKSIKRFGFASPIIARPIDGGGLEIVAGHTRHKAAQSLGLDRVPVRVMDLDPADAKLLALADNRLGELADWTGGLEDILRELDADGVDLDGLGWSAEELDALTAPPPIEPDGSEDDVPDIQEEVHSKPGEVYELGPHRLACGDCTDPAVWDGLGLVDASVFTSPPYNLTSGSLSGNKAVSDRGGAYIEPEPEWLPLMDLWTAEALSRCNVVVCNMQMLAGNKRDTFKWLHKWSSHIADVAIWDKGHAAPAMAQNVLNSVFEFMFILSDENASRSIKTGDFRGTVQNVYRGPPQRSNEFASLHGATFPIHLPMWVLSTLLAKSNEIADPFGGSGTTLIACAMTGRRARLIELDLRYCDVIRRRWTRWAKQHDQDPGPGALE